MPKVVQMDAHNHWATSSHISQRTARRGVQRARQNLGEDGIIGLIGYDSSPTEIDPRWAMFRKNLPYDVIDMQNGVYIQEERIFVWHGQEIQTKEGFDVLALGNRPEEHINHGYPLKQTLEMIRERGAIAIDTAPAHKGGSLDYTLKHPEVIQLFDGVETWNGEACWSTFGKYPRANERAAIFYEGLAKPHHGLFQIASSAGHSVKEIGSSATALDLANPIESYVGNHCRLNNDIKKGIRTHAMQGPALRERTNVQGAIKHARDLALLIAAQKIGFDGNKTTAPFIERATLGLITI